MQPPITFMCFLMKHALLVHHSHVYIVIIHGYYNSKNIILFKVKHVME